MMVRSVMAEVMELSAAQSHRLGVEGARWDCAWVDAINLGRDHAVASGL